MKKIIIILFFAPMVLMAQDKISIVSSASMFSDMAKNLITEDFEIKTIVPIGADPHKYKAKPSDAKMVQDADIVLVNGLTFEGWITDLIKNSGTKADVITITEGVEVIKSEQYENSADPHAWMNAENGLIYIENIHKALVQKNPENEELLVKRYEEYRQKIKALDEEIKSKIAIIPVDQRVLITSHDAFQYYGEKYGLKLEAIMGISTEAQAQTSDIMRVSKVIKEKNVPAVFIESTINPKMLQQIAKDNKVEIGGELFADSLDEEGNEAGSYIGMLRYNTNTIVDGLSKERKVEKEAKDPGTQIMEGMSLPVKIAVGLAFLATLSLVIISKSRKS